MLELELPLLGHCLTAGGECSKTGHIPFRCSVEVILSILQDLSLLACWVRRADCKLALTDLPLHETWAPASSGLQAPGSPVLAVVLEGLKTLPFEHLQGADLKFVVSLETVLLLTLASAKGVSNIHVLSVHSLCAQFFAGDVRMVLKPNPAFVPKVIGSVLP